jgi:hypothetical protein
MVFNFVVRIYKAELQNSGKLGFVLMNLCLINMMRNVAYESELSLIIYQQWIPGTENVNVCKIF